MALSKNTETADAARQLADVTSSLIDTLVTDGWTEAAVLTGVHSGVVARMATVWGTAFTASALEQAADELRGGYNA